MNETLRLSLRLALISGAAALLLSQVDALTREPIAEAMRRARLEAVAEVLPAYDNAPDADAVLVGGKEYYRAYAGGEPAGVAFRATSGRGYSGEIELMVGVRPDGGVSGVRILTHAETPGLGAKYADPALLDGWVAGRSLADTDWRVAKDGGDLDAVTGATVTGRAIVGAVAAGLAAYAGAADSVLAAPRGAAGEEALP